MSLNILPVGRIILGAACLLVAVLLFKAEVVDHQWMTFTRDEKGYVGGWYSPEDAVTKGQWAGSSWDARILGRDSFKVRRHVDSLRAYVLPLLCGGLGVALVFARAKSRGNA